MRPPCWIPLVLVLAGPAWSATIELSESQQARVARGQSIVRVLRRGSTLGDVVVVGRVDAPVARVFSAVSDHGSYPKIFPELKERVFVRRSARGSVWRTWVDYPWPFGEAWSEDDVVETIPNRIVRWEHLAGSIRENAGAWELEPAGEDTLVFYTIRFDPGLPVVPAWVITWASARIAPKILEDLRRYVARKDW